MDSIFACFYLTGQLKSIQQKFQLAGVVLVILNPHVFNLTGQLELKPPEFPTLARSVTARIGFSVDSDLHEKSLRRIGSRWCKTHVELDLYVFVSAHFFFVFHSE